jgi:hypothetical protein
MSGDPYLRCEECANEVVPGALWPWDTWDYPYGVERHDMCDQFPTDIHAALAVAKKIGAPTITLRWLSPWSHSSDPRSNEPSVYPRPFVTPPAGYPDPYKR